jgi:DNA-binding transcriptional ArsR family regulator
MSQGIASLHKILKDATRRKILLLLEERGSVTYTDLMAAIGIGSTGKLNYHLKILSGLISKNGDGRYFLTEKGKLSIRLLEEFCKKSESELEASFPKGYFIMVGLFSIISVVLFFSLYITGIINAERFVLYIATTILGIMFLVVADKARRKRAMSKPSTQMLGAKLSIIFAGAFAGGVILFFAGGLLIGFAAKSLGLSLFSFTNWIILSFTIGSIFGGLIGFWIYKRSKLSKLTYYDPFAE